MNLLHILVLLAGIGLLLLMVLRFKVQAFLALLVAAIFMGLATGMPMASVIKSITDGMASTLGFVATVVGIGAIFGQILESSGGAESLARSLIGKFGEDRARFALAITGFIIAIPVFLDVGFIIIVPVIYALARKTGKSLLCFAIPLLAGLAVTHAFIPPTPGPVAVAEILGADMGWLILFGFIIGLPVTLIAGPFWGSYIGRKMFIKVPDTFEAETDAPPARSFPSFGQVVAIIATPLALIVANTVSGIIAKAHGMEDEFVIQLLAFLGHPFTALLIATFLAIYFLGIRRGIDRDMIMRLSTKALAPAGLIILVTGAGGVFKEVLVDSGIGVTLAESMAGSALPPLVLAYILALIIRVTQGSATVAMITAAGIVAPIIADAGLSEPLKAIIVIAIASGATTLSHVNDSGFWLVGKYLGMNEKQTLRSWTVMETIISVTGFVFALILSRFF
ncbi:MAG: GntP family permease [Tannerella sp.]|jgi:Gnt-I system low-affinity gluconate transporter|nr:GntP family permease [Tannerella sp.]